MRFAAPEFLWWLLAVPVLIGLFVLSLRRRRLALQALGDLPLMRRLTTSASLERRIIKAVLVVLASVFLIVALARPQWGAKLESVTRRGVDVIVAVDTSLSMLAEDVKPNRMAQARAAVGSFIDLLRGDRVGVWAIALATGGKYFRSSPEGVELRRVYEEISRMDQRTLSGRTLNAYEERYQFPLGVALLLLGIDTALGERRRKVAAPVPERGEDAACDEAT